jgi:hypothetical protein
MSSAAPAGRPEAPRRTTGRNLLPTLRVAASGGLFAIGALVVVSELIALGMSFAVRSYGLWTWAKVGLLAALLSVRADVEATIRGRSFLRASAGVATYHWRLVPMLLTIGFLVLAARAGRRAARERPGRSPVVAVMLAAAGAAAPAAAIAVAAATLVTLRFPTAGLTLTVDPGAAARWAALTAAAAAAAGALLEAGRGGVPAAALRGGFAAYGWALFLLAAGVVVIATLEPAVTRAYLDALQGLGRGGGLLFGAHVLAVPSQSALLMAPAAGACLDLVGQNNGLHLCPWSLSPSAHQAGFFLTDVIPLAPWFWTLSAIPAIGAAIAGLRAVSETGGRRGIALGAIGGSVFAGVAVTGAWYAGAQVPFVLIPEVRVQADLPVMAAALAGWGVAGGALGGWLARRT